MRQPVLHVLVGTGDNIHFPCHDEREHRKIDLLDASFDGHRAFGGIESAVYSGRGNVIDQPLPYGNDSDV